jgi:hypothetical protein
MGLLGAAVFSIGPNFEGPTSIINAGLGVALLLVALACYWYGRKLRGSTPAA